MPMNPGNTQACKRFMLYLSFAIMFSAGCETSNKVDICPDPIAMYRDVKGECQCLSSDEVVSGDKQSCVKCAGNCDGKECGDDGCGRRNKCGACLSGKKCMAGKCVPCPATCDKMQCGEDADGCSCGTCTADQICNAGQCIQKPVNPNTVPFCCTPYGYCGLVQCLSPGFPCFCIDGYGQQFAGNACLPNPNLQTCVQ